MSFKKRKKNTRYRGSQTHKRGHRKRTKGSGNKGGVGMSGVENQKKSWVIKNLGIEHFGKDIPRGRGHITTPKLKVININNLIERFDALTKQGIAKMTPKGFEFNLEGYKLLAGKGATAKMSVKASQASESAIAQIKDAGGSIELESYDDKEDKAEEKKEEKAEKKVEVKKEKPIKKTK